jgi:N-acyl-D-amino-acid deacylase
MTAMATQRVNRTVRLVQYRPHPAWAGKTLAEVAAERGVDSATALIDLVADALAMADSVPPVSATGGAQVGSGEVQPVEGIIATSMAEEDVTALLRWPHANFCTDGSLTGAHPRGFGSIPRILGHYVRERRVLSLAEAVRKGTALAAAHVGVRGRGTIAPGMKADLVLFDPATILDRATPAEPHAVATGVLRTWVGGVVVYADGKATGARAGRVIRRQAP